MPNRATKTEIANDKTLDATLAALLQGYDFIRRRCERFGSDAFTTRAMLQSATCVVGEDAARMFYAPGRFTRVGAMPVMTLMLLQDFDSVQMLDGAALRHRKDMFLALATPPQIARLEEIARKEWRARIADWQARGRIVLFDETCEVLTRIACTWAAVPLSEHEAKARTREFAAMIEGSGTLGPRAWWGLFLRRGTERWARDVIHRVRTGEIETRADSPARIIAFHRELNGEPIALNAAAVELINVLRASVAVARYVVYGALMLHEKPERHQRLRAGDRAYAEAFAQEVRRLCPFFAYIGGRVREPFDWHNKHFAKGEWVVLDLYGTNIDPRSHRNATSFDPDRFLKREVCPFSFVPQGGGDVRTGHRCPGEDVTVALARVGIEMLAREMRYDVPPQDLSIRLSRIPARPKSRFIIENVRPVSPERTKVAAARNVAAGAK